MVRYDAALRAFSFLHGTFMKRLSLLAGLLSAGLAHADEVSVDVLYADGFEVATPTVYRIGSVALRDPHVFYDLSIFCVDGTDQLNAEIQQGLDADDDGDGFYDQSALAVFRPLDANHPGLLESRDGICTTASPPQCSPGIETPLVRWYEPFDVTPPTVCLGALPNTTSGYDPPVPAPGGTCFSTSAVDASLPLGTLSIPLWDTQYAAPWPAATGSTGGGLLRGFLRESDADQIQFDFGGQTVALSSLLPDGTGSCATGIAHGKDSDRGEDGWWMYLEYRLDAASSSGF